MVVVWIENFGQFFRIDALLFGTQEITVVKFSQIKRMRVRRRHRRSGCATPLR